MSQKEKPKKPADKKKAAKKPLKENNPNQYEDFHNILTRLVTPSFPDKQ